MLRRLRVDNYRCLDDFEYLPGPLHLLVGANGSGKSTVLDVLALLRDSVVGLGAAAALPGSDTVSRWRSSDLQTFELEADWPDDRLHYTLVVRHDRTTHRRRVVRESAETPDGPLFRLHQGELRLFRDDGSEVGVLPSEGRFPALSTIPEGPDTQRLVRFRRWLQAVRVLRLDPFQLERDSEREQDALAVDGHDFVSWLCGRQLRQPGFLQQLGARLAGSWPGFSGLALEPNGERHELTCKAESPHLLDPQLYDFAELSDGQRALVVLHAVLLGAEAEPGALVCVDDPAGYIAWPQLEPWLQQAREAAEAGRAQVLLASHHPQLAAALSPEQVVALERPDGGATRAATSSGLLQPEPELRGSGREQE